MRRIPPFKVEFVFSRIGNYHIGDPTSPPRPLLFVRVPPPFKNKLAFKVTFALEFTWSFPTSICLPNDEAPLRGFVKFLRILSIDSGNGKTLQPRGASASGIFTPNTEVRTQSRKRSNLDKTNLKYQMPPHKKLWGGAFLRCF